MVRTFVLLVIALIVSPAKGTADEIFRSWPRIADRGFMTSGFVKFSPDCQTLSVLRHVPYRDAKSSGDNDRAIEMLLFDIESKMKRSVELGVERNVSKNSAFLQTVHYEFAPDSRNIVCMSGDCISNIHVATAEKTYLKSKVQLIGNCSWVSSKKAVFATTTESEGKAGEIDFWVVDVELDKIPARPVVTQKRGAGRTTVISPDGNYAIVSTSGDSPWSIVNIRDRRSHAFGSKGGRDPEISWSDPTKFALCLCRGSDDRLTGYLVDLRTNDVQDISERLQIIAPPKDTEKSSDSWYRLGRNWTRGGYAVFCELPLLFKPESGEALDLRSEFGKLRNSGELLRFAWPMPVPGRILLETESATGDSEKWYAICENMTNIIEVPSQPIGNEDRFTTSSMEGYLSNDGSLVAWIVHDDQTLCLRQLTDKVMPCIDVTSRPTKKP